MKTLLIGLIFILPAIYQAHSQGFPNGQLLLGNVLATRIQSIDGPVAGPDIWGQFLLGEMMQDLRPIAGPFQHNEFGRVGNGLPTMTDIPAETWVYVQFWAWDGTVWGTDFEQVPFNQFGMTDIVMYKLGVPGITPLRPPQFTLPAVVPPIPEPSLWILVSLGGFLALSWTRRRQEARSCYGIFLSRTVSKSVSKGVVIE